LAAVAGAVDAVDAVAGGGADDVDVGAPLALPDPVEVEVAAGRVACGLAGACAAAFCA
jgi:hypothetical protein